MRRDVKNGWCVWKKIEKNVEKFLGDEELLFCMQNAKFLLGCMAAFAKRPGAACQLPRFKRAVGNFDGIVFPSNNISSQGI